MSDALTHTYRFRLTQAVTLKKQRNLMAAADNNRFISSLSVSPNGRVVEIRLSDAGTSELINPGNALKALLNDNGAFVDCEFPARLAA
jgi:hypothetical protein